MGEKSARLALVETVDGLQKAHSRVIRSEPVSALRERLGKVRIDCPGMQRDDDGLAVGASNFDRRSSNDLILSGLRGAIGNPPAQPVIANRANTRRQGGKDASPVPLQKRREIFQEQCRPYGIDRKLFRHEIGVDRPYRLFWTGTIDHQSTRCVEDQIE